MGKPLFVRALVGAVKTQVDRIWAQWEAQVRFQGRSGRVASRAKHAQSLDALEARQLMAIPSAPINAFAESAASTQNNVSWTDTSNDEQGFKIMRSTDGVNFTTVATIATPNTTFWRDFGAVAGTTYWYGVRSYNADGSSTYPTDKVQTAKQLPFHGRYEPGSDDETAHSIPATLDVEYFDKGGQGISQSDTNISNEGGKFRNVGVDIETTNDTGGGYHVGFTKASEWLEFTINVPSAGTYNPQIRVANSATGGSFHLEFYTVDGSGNQSSTPYLSTSATSVPNTGGLQTFTTLSLGGVSLSAGTQVMRLVMDSVSTTSTIVGNFNWFALNTPPDTQAPTSPTGLQSQFGTGGAVELTWVASTDNVGVTGYRVYRDGAEIGQATGTSFTDSEPGTGTVTYAVAAFDAASNLSSQSGPLIVFSEATPAPLPAAADPGRVVTLTGGAGDDHWYVQLKAGSTTVVEVYNAQSATGSKQEYTLADYDLFFVQSGTGNDTFTVASGTIPLSTSDVGISGVNLAVTVGGAGTLQLTTSQHLKSLAINDSATVELPAGADEPYKVIELGSLSVATNGRLDIGDNAVVLRSGDMAAVHQLVNAGYDEAIKWDGRGITSLAARDNTSHVMAVGAIPNGQRDENWDLITDANGNPKLVYERFEGLTVGANDILIKYVPFGDSDLRGRIDADDYARFDRGFLERDKGWYGGDFDYSGLVDLSDTALIDDAYEYQTNNNLIVPPAPTSGSVTGPLQYTLDLPASTAVTSWTVSWGDGTSETVSGGSASQVSRTYESAGEYLVTVFAKTVAATYHVFSANARLAMPVVGDAVDVGADTQGGEAFGTSGGDPVSLMYSGAVRYFDGTVRYTSSDIDATESGILSGHSRTWTNAIDAGPDDVNGTGWSVSQMPALAQTAEGIIAAGGGRASVWFNGSDQSGYVPAFYHRMKLEKVTGAYKLTDSEGNVTTYFDFSDATKAGKIKQYVDAGGNVTDYTYAVNGWLEKIQRRDGGTVPLEEVRYTVSQATPGQLGVVTVLRRIGGVLTNVRRASYEYYGTGSSFGAQGYLKRVVVDHFNAAQQWVPVERKMYRYDGAGRLTTVVEGASYERLRQSLVTPSNADPDPTVASEAAVNQYADFVFAYYGSGESAGRVAFQTIQGKGTYQYSYSPATTNTGPNQWRYKTTEILPDETSSNPLDNDRRTVYTNSYGEVVLDVFKSGSKQWRNFYKYDAAGRIVYHAMPSAVTNHYEESAEILNAPSTSNSNLEGLADSAGLIDVFTYGTSTASGDAPGHLKDYRLARGENALNAGVLQAAYEYLQRPMSQTYVLSAEKVFRNEYTDAGTAQAIRTAHAYTFHGSTDRIASMTTTLPPVNSASQNGSGATNTSETVLFDTFGRPVWHKDADGFVHFTRYDLATGAVTETIEDTDPTDPSIVNPPIAGPSRGSGLPSALQLRTIMAVDGLGRTTSITAPKGVVTSAANDFVTNIDYVDTAIVQEVRTTPPATTGASEQPPIHVLRHDRANGVLYEFDVVRGGTGLTSLTRTNFDVSNRLESVDRFETTPTSSYQTGSEDVLGTFNFATAPSNPSDPFDPYYRTEYGYDARGRLDRTVVYAKLRTDADLNDDEKPTITRTVYDGLDRPVATHVGTDDLPDTGFWAPGAAGTNLVKVSENEFDDGLALDGNLTRVTQFPGDDGPNRVAETKYDWRNRAVLSGSGVSVGGTTNTPVPVTLVEYDNLNQPVTQRIFDGNTLNFSSLNPSTIASVHAGKLRRFDETFFDDRGRVYRTTQHEVNQTTGATTTGKKLDTDHWYDDRDNVVKTRAPGGLVTKVKYDGVGREVQQSLTDGGGDSTWDHAKTVDLDIVLEQVLTSYDRNGNAVLVTTRQRDHDATATGDLAANNARVSFVGSWYDDADRLSTVVDFGNHGNDTLFNSSETYQNIDVTAAPPSRPAVDTWDPFLRTDYQYDGASRLEYMTSPRGIRTRTFYDDLGRKVHQIEAYTGSGLPSTTSDRSTRYAYNGLDQVTQKDVETYSKGAGGTLQPDTLTTTYTYGVTATGANKINHNGLLAKVAHGQINHRPAGVTEDSETFSYNALGEVTETVARNTTVHNYVFDSLGRLTDDIWTNAAQAPAGMDTDVQKLTYGYDALGRGTLFTSLDSTGAILNQVKRDFDGLGRLQKEFQSHNLDVTGSTPAVEYDYESITSNRSRLERIIYPDGRSVWFGYNDTALNNAISRVGYLYDHSGVETDKLETYQYLGLDRVIERSYPRYNYSNNNGVLQTTPTYLRMSYRSDDAWIGVSTYAYLHDDAGSADDYDGLDRFGRVVDHGWRDGAGSASTNNYDDRRVYGYDADGNVLYADSPKPGAWESWRDELYQESGDDASDAYDPLGRMTNFSRGSLSGTGRAKIASTAVVALPDDNNDDVTVTRSQTWGIDESGNFDRAASTEPLRQIFQGEVPLTDQPNPENELPDDGRIDTFVKFDAWGRMSIKRTATLRRESEFDPLRYDNDPINATAYEYDALGRRISEESFVNVPGEAQQDSTLHLYFDDSGHMLEARREEDAAPFTVEQYVWSAAGENMMVLRDDLTGVSGGTFGNPASDLDRRVWVMQGPDASVWQVRLDGGNPTEFEQYVYTPEGEVFIVGKNSATGNDFFVFPRSNFDWRYLWHAGRAGVYSTFSPGTTNVVTNYDGMLEMNGREYDTIRGTPVTEDVYAYKRTDGSNAYSEWTGVNTELPGNGTDPSWSRPTTDTSTSMWTYVPQELWGTVSGAGKEIGYRAADFANAYIYLRSGGQLGSSNQKLSRLSQIQAAGDTTLLRATFSSVPIVGSGYNVITGTDLLTGETLNGSNRTAAGFGLLADFAFAGAAGLKLAGINPTLRLPSSVRRSALLGSIEDGKEFTKKVFGSRFVDEDLLASVEGQLDDLYRARGMTFEGIYTNKGGSQFFPTTKGGRIVGGRIHLRGSSLQQPLIRVLDEVSHAIDAASPTFPRRLERLLALGRGRGAEYAQEFAHYQLFKRAAVWYEQGNPVMRALLQPSDVAKLRELARVTRL